MNRAPSFTLPANCGIIERMDDATNFFYTRVYICFHLRRKCRVNTPD
jgi:hypothetical protein